MDLNEVFEENGFLGEGIANGIDHIRAENADWFKIAEDVNAALMRAAKVAAGTAKPRSMSPEGVAMRLLFRSCGTFQGIILLTERGMVAEGRTLARSLIENAFCIAALTDNSDAFIKMFKEDSEASRHRQRKFIDANNLITAGAKRDQLKAAIDAIGKIETMSPKKVAELGPMVELYLAYQRLSDDSAHPSARALERHVRANADRSGWDCKWCIGDQGENAATLNHTIQAALAIGVGVTQLLKDMNGNAEFGDLSERFQAMPPVPVV